MRNTRRKLCRLAAIMLTISVTASGMASGRKQQEIIKADTTDSGEAPQEGIILNKASITSEITGSRNRFTKQFRMSDGTCLAAVYSMPVHYKESGVSSKDGKWKEINTTLKKAPGKKYYKTKSTSLQIQAAAKADAHSLIKLKRGSSALSWALQGKKLRAARAVIKNPKKKQKTDLQNQNQVQYKKVRKGINLCYQIYPEKVTEIITITKKQKKRSITYHINSGNLKVKVKNGRVYFCTKKGKTRYTRLKTILTDAKGVSSTKVKVTYNKKKKTLTVTPDKKWWNSKKRKFPIQLRTATITDKHERDVRIGAAYAGAPSANYTYDSSLLLQSGKCTAFTKMSKLDELKNRNAQILSASFHLNSEKTLKLGAGKTFDIGIYKVKESWSPKKVTYNNRPSYETTSAGTVSLTKKGSYTTDITGIVKDWYKGEADYGIALAAENTNGTIQARLNKNPYFTIRYEIVGFDGAEELKENQPVKRDVLKTGQENYYYFDAEPGIAYDLYTTSTLDTQGTLYDKDKKRLDYDDNSGESDNLAFIRSYNGRHYLKASTKGNAIGSYTLTLKKRFAVPTLTGKQGQDRYIISWNPIEKAKEYLVAVYDAKGKVSETVVTGTTYEYAYTDSTVGKTLAFTVTPRESSELTGEESRRIYNTDSHSPWSYSTPMLEERQNFSSAVCDGKIYVLGGEKSLAGNRGLVSLTGLEVYDTKKETWTRLADYPGSADGICHAAMAVIGTKIYVIGGQSSSSSKAKVYNGVFVYDTTAGTWEKKKDMAEPRTKLSTAVHEGKIYAFSQIGTTERVDVYDLTEDHWEEHIYADKSTIVQAFTIDGRIFVLREEGNSGKGMYVEEYRPETAEYDNEGKMCPFANADRYTSGTAVNGKIYMNKEKETNQVVSYNIYTDEWAQEPILNLQKGKAQIRAVDTTLYSIGGTMTGFGTLDVVEKYTLDNTAISKQMEVKKGEDYELQTTAGRAEDDTEYIITLRTDPKVLSFCRLSSFMQREELEKGKDGIKLIHCAPDKGVLVFSFRDTMETGGTAQAYQSVPVRGLADTVTTVQMQVERRTRRA